MVTFVQSYSYNRPFDGSHNVEVALSENEFDTPVLRVQEIDKTIRGKADIPASFPAVKGTGEK